MNEIRKLPGPECPYGYTRRQIEEILGTEISRFDKWFIEQTGVYCTGYDWNEETEQYIANSCFSERPGYHTAGHGPVVYPEDLGRFVKGQGPLD